MENCLPWEGAQTGAGDGVGSPAPEEKGASQTRCDEQIWFSFLIPLHHRGVQKSGVKSSLERREGWEEGVLRFGVLSHYPALILVCNKFM